MTDPRQYGHALELGILRFFAAHSDEIVSRESLINGLWGISYSGTTRTIDTHVSCLRQKLGADGARIKTVYGAVYRYRKYPRPQHIPAWGQSPEKYGDSPPRNRHGGAERFRSAALRRRKARVWTSRLSFPMTDCRTSVNARIYWGQDSIGDRPRESGFK